MSNLLLDRPTVKMKRLFKPVEPDPYPKAFTDAYSGTAQSFSSLVANQWNQAGAFPFNVQGQQWQNSGLGAGGKNVTTPRTSGGQPVWSVQEWEFDFNDDKLDVMLIAFGDYDMQVYITEQGKTWKLRADPLAEVGAVSYRFRNITLPDRQPRSIRCVLAGQAFFVQIHREQRAVLRPSADRPMIILDGDSYVDAFHAKNAGSVRSFYSFGIADAIFEATGIVSARHGEGSSGVFNNGNGVTVTTDASGPNGTSRWGSAQRITYATPDLVRKPLAYVFNGTINDAALAGGTAAMKKRLFEIYAALVAVDPGLPIVHVGPEPYDGTAIGGGPWGAGSGNDQNRIAMQQAIAEHPNGAGFIDPALTGIPWFTGSGYENIPTTSQQAQGTGADKLHGNAFGYENYGTLMAAALGEIPVPLVRAEAFL